MLFTEGVAAPQGGGGCHELSEADGGGGLPPETGGWVGVTHIEGIGTHDGPLSSSAAAAASKLCSTDCDLPIQLHSWLPEIQEHHWSA
jgi:hypothetical protein